MKINISYSILKQKREFYHTTIIIQNKNQTDNDRRIRLSYDSTISIDSKLHNMNIFVFKALL